VWAAETSPTAAHLGWCPHQLTTIKYILVFCFAFLLLFVEKVTKRHPKTITARFREGALIYLLCYCNFNYMSLKCYIKK
jgi:hypothetical protein